MKGNIGTKLAGHASALFTTVVWGCTFIASKILLAAFSPVEILLMRFVLGFILLILIRPKLPKFTGLRGELYFIAAGITGVAGYYLLENIALTYTLAANVSVITASAPFFTCLFAQLFLKEKHFNRYFVLGFICAMVGIALISYTGSGFDFDIWGTLLALGAAFCWGIYSILVKKAGETGLTTIEMTQRFFFYGLIFMLLFIRAFGFSPDLSLLSKPDYLLSLLFLGIIASGVCFLTWNVALDKLGTVEASVYIYAVPVITVFVSIPVLHEKITMNGFIGMALALAGLVLSEIKPVKKAPGHIIKENRADEE